jgi:RNA polymerase sigma-70 factor (ECF subfamily)
MSWRRPLRDARHDARHDARRHDPGSPGDHKSAAGYDWAGDGGCDAPANPGHGASQSAIGPNIAPDAAHLAAHFNALVEQHAAKLLGVAAAIVGMADAEDVVQEAIVRAWQAWPTLRDREAFSAWLLRITVNVGRDWLRGRFGTHRRLTEPFGDAEAEVGPALFADDPGASDHAAALDLRRAISQLAGELRVVVALRYYAGLDATEIGNALGMPSATVRTRLRRALRVLRERLAESGAHRAVRAYEEDRHV